MIGRQVDKEEVRPIIGQQKKVDKKNILVNLSTYFITVIIIFYFVI